MTHMYIKHYEILHFILRFYFVSRFEHFKLLYFEYTGRKELEINRLLVQGGGVRNCLSMGT